MIGSISRLRAIIYGGSVRLAVRARPQGATPAHLRSELFAYLTFSRGPEAAITSQRSPMRIIDSIFEVHAVLTSALFALSLASCPGQWRHTSNDPAYSSLAAEVTSTEFLARFDDGGYIHGSTPEQTEEGLTFDGSDGPVRMSNCTSTSASLEFDNRRLDLVRTGNAGGPETWCDSEVRGFISLQRAYELLRTAFVQQGEFETTTQFESRSRDTRSRVLAENRFLPVLVSTTIGRYNADLQAFDIGMVAELQGKVMYTASNPHESSYNLSVPLEKARSVRSRYSTMDDVPIFIVIEIDSDKPIRTNILDSGTVVLGINSTRMMCSRMID